MAQVLPAERELRRVIGDGEGTPDREVDGLTEQDLLELHRSMVLRLIAHSGPPLGRSRTPLEEPRGSLNLRLVALVTGYPETLLHVGKRRMRFTLGYPFRGRRRSVGQRAGERH